MKIASYNIGRGLVRKLEALEAFVHEERIDIVGVSETDLTNDDFIPQVEGFTAFPDRSLDLIRLIVYVRTGLPAEQKIKRTKMPAVFLQVGQISVSFVYNDFTSVGHRLSEPERRVRLQEVLVEHAGHAGSQSLLIGDMNIDWSKSGAERDILDGWAVEEGYDQLVNFVTRPSGGSTIDLAFGRGDKMKKCEGSDPGVSDHLAVICTIAKTVIKPKWRKITRVKLTPEVLFWARQNMPIFDNNTSLQELYTKLCEYLDTVRNLSTTVKTIRVDSGPSWFTEQLRALRSRVALSSGEGRKRVRNAYVSALRRAKREHERQRINRPSGSVWRILQGNQSSEPIEIQSDRGVQTGVGAAENLREYFQGKIEKLKRDPTPTRIKELFRQHLQDITGWKFSTIEPEDLHKLIDDLKPKKSSGPDGISYYTLKQLKFEVAPVLLRIVNKSIQESQFLSAWKVGKVIPLYKGKGSRSDPSSFRPVTLTSVVGRVVEMVARRQLVRAMEDRKAFTESQYGFRVGGGTAKCLTACLDEVRNQLGEGNYVALVNCDGSSAFDLIPRGLVRDLVAMSGANDGVVKWIESYFEDRKHYVVVDGHRSSEWTVDVGSVQGGPASPNFYNILSVTQTLWNSFARSFQLADDDSECVSGSSKEECNELIARAASGMTEWFSSAGLTVNPKKSEVIGFNFCPDPVIIAGETVTPIESVRFLGVIIRSDLKWTDQVAALCSSIRRSAARIRVEGRHLSVNERRILYQAWIGGKLHSNAGVYLGLMSGMERKKVQTAINAGVRSILGAPRRGRVGGLDNARRKLGLMGIDQLIERYELLLAWELRDTMRSMASGGLNTRRKDAGDVVVPDQRGRKAQITLTRAAKAWNRVPEEVRNTENKKKALGLIKRHVFNNCS